MRRKCSIKLVIELPVAIYDVRDVSFLVASTRHYLHGRWNIFWEKTLVLEVE